MKIKFVFVLLCFTTASLSTILGQTNKNKINRDSLIIEWQNELLTDSSRLNALNQLAFDYYLYKKPDSAIYYGNIQLDLAKKSNHVAMQISSFNTIGTAYYIKGNYPKAEEYYLTGKSLAEDTFDSLRIAKFMGNLGVLYYIQGNFDKAIESQKKCLEINLNFNSVAGTATAYHNLGNIYLQLGDYSKALIFYSKAIEAHEKGGNKKSIAGTLNSIGTLYKYQGDLKGALKCYTNSLTIYQELNDDNGRAASLMNIGVILAEEKKYEKAFEYLMQSLELRIKMGDNKNIAQAYSNLGTLYLYNSNYTEAKTFFFKCLNIREQLGDKKNLPLILYNLGSVYAKLDQTDSALYYFNHSLQIAEEIGLEKEMRLNFRALAVTQNHLQDSLSLIESMNGLIQLRKANLKYNFFELPEIQKEIYFGTMESDFGLCYDVALRHGKGKPELIDSALNLALQIKSLTLKSSTLLKKKLLDSQDTLVINLYQEWIILREKIAANDISEMSLEMMEQRANLIEKQLIQKSGLQSDFNLLFSLDWTQLKKSLKKNEAAVEFIHFRSDLDTLNEITYAAFIVLPTSKHPILVKICTEDQLKKTLGGLQGNNISSVQNIYGNKQNNSNELYKLIWQPLEQYIRKSKTIYYSPTGLLYKVSFAAIRIKNELLLSDNYQLRQMNSTGNVTYNNSSQINEEDNFFLMGGVQYNTDTTEKSVWNYLPGTLEETDAISELIEKNKFKLDYYKEQNASEKVFKNSIGNSNFIHIATHGFFFPDPNEVKKEMAIASEEENFSGELIFRSSTNYARWSFVENSNPLMRSGIVLAGANDVWSRNPLMESEDGILTAQEVSNLDLRNAKLVVLSACETGLGDIKGSEGVYGLQRSFKMAGAKYLIMSLWQVPDKETSEFMICFYENLLSKKNIPDAFLQTQKMMRSKYDPYYWAAFILIE